MQPHINTDTWKAAGLASAAETINIVPDSAPSDAVIAVALSGAQNVRGSDSCKRCLWGLLKQQMKEAAHCTESVLSCSYSNYLER